MFFSNPVALYGLLALAIPILLHLERRRLTRKLPFAFVEFLLEAQKNRFWSLKVQQLLLLFMRLLVVAAVVLALAQLHVRAGGIGRIAGWLRGAPNSAVVILVDVSPSMSATEDGVSRLDSARKLARGLLASIDPQSEILLMPFSDGGGQETTFFGRNRAKISAAIDNLTISGQETRLLFAVEAAARRLDRYQAGTVFIVSDLQTKAAADLAGGVRSLIDRYGNVALVLVPVQANGHSNLAIGDAWTPQLPLLRGEMGETGAAIHGYGRDDAPAVVENWTVQLPGSASRESRFTPPPGARDELVSHRFLVSTSDIDDSTTISARLTISPEEGFAYEDAIPGDNSISVHYSVLPVPDVLVVGGQTAALAQQSYRALFSGGKNAPIRARAAFTEPAQLPNDLNDDFEAVVLLEDCPAQWPVEAVSALQTHLRAGKGILLYTGEDSSGNLLDALGVRLSRQEADTTALSLASGKDVFVQELESVSKDMWERVSCQGAHNIEGYTSAWVVASDDAVVVAGKNVAGGRLLVSSIGLQLERGNLSIDSVFFPFSQVAMKYLLSAEKEAPARLERLCSTSESDIACADAPLLKELKDNGMGLLSAAAGNLNAARYSAGRFTDLTSMLLWLALLLGAAECWMSNRI
jgi:von Willebrand factor type A domain/Aerotolerance regulator N-terminal